LNLGKNLDTFFITNLPGYLPRGTGHSSGFAKRNMPVSIITNQLTKPPVVFSVRFNFCNFYQNKFCNYLITLNGMERDTTQEHSGMTSNRYSANIFKNHIVSI